MDDFDVQDGCLICGAATIRRAAMAMDGKLLVEVPLCPVHAWKLRTGQWSVMIESHESAAVGLEEPEQVRPHKEEA